MTNRVNLESPTQIRPQPCLQPGNYIDNLVPPTNPYGKGDSSTSLSNNRGVGGVGGVEGLEVVERRTRTREVHLPQRLRG